MIHLTTSTLIERPIQQVFDFVSTPENDFQWQYGTLATASLPQHRGARQNIFRSIGHLLGRRNLGTFQVIDYEPDRRYAFQSLSGPVHSKTSYALESVKGWTSIHISVQASAPNFFQITERLLENTMREQFEEDVSTLKIILEQNAAGFHVRLGAV